MIKVPSCNSDPPAEEVVIPAFGSVRPVARSSPFLPRWRRRGLSPGLAAWAVFAAVLGGSCERKKEPPPPPPPPEVLVTAVVQRDVPITGEWLGTTDGIVNAEVRSRVQGYLIAQNYTEGATVRKGDPLYEVDPRPFEAALAQAKADLSQARAEQARTELDVARLTPLAPSGAVSQQEVDNARQSNEANKAAVEAAQAAVEQAELNLAYTRITAPIDGVAGFSQAQIGDLVGGPGSAVLTVISTLDPIRVYVPISEQEYLRFERKLEAEGRSRSDPVTGPSMDLILSDGTLYGHKGVLEVVNRQADPTTGTIRVSVKFPNPGNILRPGLYAKIRAVISTRKDALLVPQRAVVDLQGVYLVAVVADGKAALRPVQVAERAGSDWVVTGGLKPGEQVVVEGVQKVRDGMAVSAKPYVAPPAAGGPPPKAGPSAATAPPAAGSGG